MMCLFTNSVPLQLPPPIALHATKLQPSHMLGDIVTGFEDSVGQPGGCEVRVLIPEYTVFPMPRYTVLLVILPFLASVSQSCPHRSYFPLDDTELESVLI